VAARPHWPSPEEGLGTTGLTPNRDRSASGTGIIGARDGIRSSPTGVPVVTDMVRAGQKDAVMANAGRTINIMATMPSVRRAIRLITDAAGICHDTHRGMA